MTRLIAVLLCAGFGTRMGRLTERTPKALLPVAGKPVVDYLLAQLAGLAGLEAIEVVTNARDAGAFARWAEDRGRELAARGRELRIHDDGRATNAERRGAVGDLAFVLSRVGLPDGALVAAGDNVLRFSLDSFWRAFLGSGETTVMALDEPVPERLRRTGVLELGAGDRVLRLHEKPARPPSAWACPPIYGLCRAALGRVDGYLADGHPGDEIGRFIAHLVERQPVRAFRVDGERLDVGSPDAYRRADALLRREAVVPSRERPLDPPSMPPHDQGGRRRSSQPPSKGDTS